MTRLLPPTFPAAPARLPAPAGKGAAAFLVPVAGGSVELAFALTKYRYRSLY